MRNLEDAMLFLHRLRSRTFFTVIVAANLVASLSGQSMRKSPEKFSPAIEDNSFFIEERSELGKEIRYTLTAYNIGASVVWLAGENQNLLLEYAASISTDVHDDGSAVRSTESIVNPGFRYAVNTGSLQIVPGVGFPAPLARTMYGSGCFCTSPSSIHFKNSSSGQQS